MLLIYLAIIVFRWQSSFPLRRSHGLFFFFFKYPAPPEIYPLSLHDAFPIFVGAIVSHPRRAAMKRIVRLDIPLPRKEKVSQIGNGLRCGFDDVVTQRLDRSIVVRDHEP